MCSRLVVAASSLVLLAHFSAFPASAGTLAAVRVISEQAPILERTSLKSAVIATAPSGTVLVVLDKLDAWYWVLLERDTYGTQRPGWIEARHVEFGTTASAGYAPRSFAGLPDQVQTALEAPNNHVQKPTEDPKPDRRLRRAMRKLEQARKRYEQLTQRDEPPASDEPTVANEPAVSNQPAVSDDAVATIEPDVLESRPIPSR